MLEGFRTHNLSMKYQWICNEVTGAGKSANLLSFAYSLKTKPFDIGLVFL